MTRLRVAAHDLGGAGPTLLLLHANGFHGRVFTPMVPILAPCFRCVALDLPGHGVAPDPDGPFGAEDILAAVCDYVDANALHGCYVLGHSLGGVVAALLQLARPGTFRAMFLFEPVMRPQTELLATPPPPPPPQSNSPPSCCSEGAGATPRSAAAGASASGAGGGGRGGVAGGGSGGGSASPPPLAPPAPGDSLLARIARKRQASFPSVDAAIAALGSKPPFNGFHPKALHAYLACGGLRPVDAAAPSAAPAPAAAPAASASASRQASAPPGGAAGAVPGPAAGGATGVTLSCAPETEARVYEALEPPPVRPWHRLTQRQQPCAHAVPGCRQGGCGCGGGGGDATGGLGHGGGGGCHCCCRVAFAVGRVAGGLHGRLAVWTEQLAQEVPGAKLFRFPELQHLGPMVSPSAVAAAALGFFLNDSQSAAATAGEAGGGGVGGCSGEGEGGSGCRQSGAGGAGGSGTAAPGPAALEGAAAAAGTVSALVGGRVLVGHLRSGQPQSRM